MPNETHTKEEFYLLEPEIRNSTLNYNFLEYLKEEIIDSDSLWFRASFIGKQKWNNSSAAISKNKLDK